MPRLLDTPLRSAVEVAVCGAGGGAEADGLVDAPAQAVVGEAHVGQSGGQIAEGDVAGAVGADAPDAVARFPIGLRRFHQPIPRIVRTH